jgi:choline-sulfatase
MVGRIVAALKKAGVYDDTAIIISADHGENQGELAIYGEHATADHITCRVPLIIKWPAGRSGATDDGLHYSLDLAPTLMDLLGGQKQPLWDGESYAASITRAAATGREDLVISHGAHVCQRSVRWDRWLYMRTYHDGFHLFPEEMLFDVVADPHEQHDLASSRPDLCHEGAWRLARWHDAQMQKIARIFPHDVTDPLWRSELAAAGVPQAARSHRPSRGGGGVAEEIRGAVSWNLAAETQCGTGWYE